MTNVLHAEPRDDDDDLVIGNRAMSVFATEEGCPVSTSTMQKVTSPAIATGPTLVGYFGTKPATTRGLMRAWLRSRIRPVGARAAQRGQALASAQVIITSPPSVPDMAAVPVRPEALPPSPVSE